MRHLLFSPDQLPPDQEDFWSAWEEGARAATEELLTRADAGESIEPDKEDIWRHLKEWFLEHVFAGKCAYCEGECLAHAPQHAEHWRPKGKLTQLEEDREVPVKRDGIAHPGYWWLAYSWENLVPSCFYCNTGKGKGTKFPIAGRYAFAPVEGVDVSTLDSIEKPWLLHPLKEPKPERHIGFQDNGTAYAKEKSEYGYWTIKILNLNRENLVNSRRKRQEEAVDAFGQALSDFARFDNDLTQTMRKWEGAEARFSRAVQDRLLSIRGRVESQMGRR